MIAVIDKLSFYLTYPFVFCPVLRSSTAAITVIAITSGISFVTFNIVAIAVAQNATWESPSPINENLLRTSVTPRSDEHNAIRTPTIRA